MGKIILITGGARSGKSSFAEKLAIQQDKRLFYIATGQPLDREMHYRIKKHRLRRGKIWKTIEESKNIFKVLHKISDGVAVLDCVTLWISNLISAGLSDANIRKEVLKILKIADKGKFSIIIVTNEVGNGIVPDNKLARRYRDLLGIINQIIADKANTVLWMCSGIPVEVKHG